MTALEMNRARAAIGSAVFLVIAPGVAAGLVPWLLTGWSTNDWWPPPRVLGGLMIVAGLAVLLSSFARFASEGVGTPAPVAPTERLVVGGVYRYVRNPMYLAVDALIVGQAFLLGQAVLLVYAAAFTAAPTSKRCLRGGPGASSDFYTRSEGLCQG
jgi:protein-S-isoprenylcysteine O-methyltransferase Ste14